MQFDRLSALRTDLSTSDSTPATRQLRIIRTAHSFGYLIMQDRSQLLGAYGRDESIISNCHVRIAYAPNQIETAEWLSRMAGTTTIVKEDITSSGSRYAATLSHVSMTFYQIDRPLITPDEVMRLRALRKDATDTIVEPAEMLVFVAGHAPIQRTQSLYFRDPVFLERSQLTAPDATAGVGMRKLRPFVLPDLPETNESRS